MSIFRQYGMAKDAAQIARELNLKTADALLKPEAPSGDNPSKRASIPKSKPKDEDMPKKTTPNDLAHNPMPSSGIDQVFAVRDHVEPYKLEGFDEQVGTRVDRGVLNAIKSLDGKYKLHVQQALVEYAQKHGVM